METGPRALVRAGDGTVGTLVAMAGGPILVTLSHAGERGTASRGIIRGNVVINCLAPPQPSWIATMAASSVGSVVTSSISRSLCDAATPWVQTSSWPLVRLVTWLLTSFMATVFYKEAMVWLTGRFLRMPTWRQFFNLAATIIGGEKWSLVACTLPCIAPTV